MKTYYVKVRGNIFMGKFGNDYCHYENYSIFRVKVRFRKRMKNLFIVQIMDTNIEESKFPTHYKNNKILDDWEFECEIQDQDRLKW
ncbi:MAG: hypothetical protein ACRCW9_04010 [Cetobacterium sp.]